MQQEAGGADTALGGRGGEMWGSKATVHASRWMVMNVIELECSLPWLH